MRYIDLENNPPDQNWIDRADALTLQLTQAADKAARDAIIDANQNMWAELKNHLRGLSLNKCWYSESKNDSAHCHVDHFRPKKEAIDENGDDKGGYWWLAFEWLNYRYSAPVENIRKKAYFHVNANKANTPADSIENEDIRFLDPTEIQDPDKLAYTNEGLVTPKSTVITERNFIQAEYTIRRMNLNKQEMKDTRKDKYSKTILLIKSTDKLVQLQNANICMARKQKIAAQMKELLALASSKSEYSAAVKFCMRSSGLIWVDNLLSRAA
ncbi:hypothetical protein VOI54_03155 [Tamlana sp. 2201CG12-4]|uniref:hypothetical protein n=1 Tax=Tamlana sp. 2201CG12-4 TaxID=3112582 RepID=UPI002DB62985|nr:hypothetical protein [Tamlana sp. 2201CG12-4]MEC3905998.1 hypothetical protein [Tamlana sp. 2201CG12-4]